MDTNSHKIVNHKYKTNIANVNRREDVYIHFYRVMPVFYITICNVLIYTKYSYIKLVNGKLTEFI